MEPSRVHVRPLDDDGQKEAPEEPQRLLAVTRRDDGRRIGLIGYRLHYPDSGWLAFGSVAFGERTGDRSLLEEAVRLVEDETLARGEAERLWAEVPQQEGLRLYFWLRLGYRPARESDAPWQVARQRDIIAMIRMPQ